MEKCFQNVTLVLPGRIVPGGSVCYENGKITAVSAKTIPSENALDGQGMYLMPGFVDVHVHGCAGYEMGDGSADSMRQIAKNHCAHGTTSMLPTLSAASKEVILREMEIYRQVVAEGTGGCDFCGIHLEGPYFSHAGKGAQPANALRDPDLEETEEILEAGEGILRRWDAAPELPHADEFARAVKAKGIWLSEAHTDATAAEALKGFEWGYTHMTHLFCGMSIKRKRNQLVTDGALEASLITDDVTVEIIGDGRHVSRESLLLALKLKGKEKIALITDATRGAFLDAQGYEDLKKRMDVNFIIEDNVAKMLDRSYYHGSIAGMDRVLREVTAYGVALETVVEMMTLTPARLAGIADCKGSLEVGKDADFVLMDRNLQLQGVWVRGEKRA